MYICGVDAMCADKDLVAYVRRSDGVSTATATFAGLVAYMLGKEQVPFEFGNAAVPQCQSIVKYYFTFRQEGIPST